VATPGGAPRRSRLPHSTVASLKRYLTFAFQGDHWARRFLVGSALVFVSYVIPVLPLIFVNGYSLRVMGAALRGEALYLPPWTDWGKLGRDGLRLLVIGVVYTLPGVAVILAGLSLHAGLTILVPPLAANVTLTRDLPGFVMVGLSFAGGMVVTIITALIGLVLILAGTGVLPAATAHFVATDRLAAAFHIREWWPLVRSNKMGYLTAWIIALALAIGITVALNLGYYAVFLCCLIPIVGSPLSFYTMLISAAIFGDTYREGIAIRRAAQRATDSAEVAR
jgi:hypothetical protein